MWSIEDKEAQMINVKPSVCYYFGNYVPALRFVFKHFRNRRRPVQFPT